jgi:hypothetical protein
MNGMTAKIKQHYFALPLLVKVYATKKLSIDFGPRVAYVVSAHQTISGDGVSASVNYYERGRINKFDVGLAAGLSYRVIPELDLSVRYTHGFVKLASNEMTTGLGYEPTYPVFEEDSTNSLLQFSAGLWF